MLRLSPLLLLPAVLAAQGVPRDLEFHLGRWLGGNHATTYMLRSTASSDGAVSHAVTASVILHDSLGRRRAFYGAGYELEALRGRSALAPYLLLGAELGLSTDTTTQELAIGWALGGGVEWRPVWWLAAGVEARYRLEDRGPRGFWRASADSPRGVAATVGLSIGIGRGTSARSRTTGTEPLPPPAAPPPGTITGDAADVVETAIDVLGTPYQWGGTADNGFDCSGLIQYAYGQHGIRLPRQTRDQAHAGAEVPPIVEALRPGDILLFSMRPGAGVTHVGMYVADGKFIHSDNQGVVLSRLDVHDPQGAYWLAHWVGARRVIP